jgi:hypothetical protein
MLVCFVGDTHFETAYPKILCNFPQLLEVNTLSGNGTSAPTLPRFFQILCFLALVLHFIDRHTAYDPILQN